MRSFEMLCLMLGLFLGAQGSSAQSPILKERARAHSGGGVYEGVADDLKLKPLACWTCDIFMGNAPVGSTITYDTYIYAEGDIEITYSNYTFTGSSEFSVTTDNCSGATVNNSSCTLQFTFTPTSVGSSLTHSAQVVFPAHVCETVSPFDCYDDATIFNLTADVTKTIPRVECIDSGSIIHVDTQAVGESIPIVGTPFSMVYTSEYSANYISPYNTLGVKNIFNPDLWTVSVHHYYDTVQNRLFLGTGSTVNKSSLPLTGGNLLVLSLRGDEVYVFSSAGRHLSTTTALTGALKYTFAYGSSGRLISITDAYSNVTTFTRDGSGHLTDIVAPFGQDTVVTTSGGAITSVTNPNGEAYGITYNSGTTLMATFTKPAGQVSTFTYDSNGRMIEDLGNGGNFWTLVQSATSPHPYLLTSNLGRVKSVLQETFGPNYQTVSTLPDGNVLTHHESGSGDAALSDVNHQSGTVIAFVDDERYGKAYRRRLSAKLTMEGVTSEEDYAQTVTYPGGVTPAQLNYSSITNTSTVSGGVQTYVFDASAKTHTYTSAEGATQVVTLDAKEALTQVQLGNDTPWTFTYDSNGRVTQATQSSHNTVNYSYNSSGQMQSATNVRGETTSYMYDLAGRVTQVTLPDSRAIAYAYDSNGNVSSVTTPAGQVHKFFFDAFEGLGEYLPPNGLSGIYALLGGTYYTRNNDKQVTAVTRADGSEIDYTFDATTAQLTGVSTPVGNFTYSYSGVDQHLSRAVAPTGIRDDFTYYGTLLASDTQARDSDGLVYGAVSYGYDSDHRLSSRTVVGKAGTPSSALSYVYNSDSLPTQVGSLSLTYSYPAGRLASTSIGQVSDAYTYDSYGNLVGYSAFYSPLSGAAKVLYSYSLTRDSASRIISKSETIDTTTTLYDYNYDLSGQLISVKTNGKTTASFKFDLNGNRVSGILDDVSFSASYNVKDQVQTYGNNTYTFTANGDLSQIQLTPKKFRSFSYDANGMLIYATDPSGAEYNFLVDGKNRRVVRVGPKSKTQRVLFDQDRFAATIGKAGGIEKEFVYAIQQNVPDYMNFGGQKYRIFKDHLGSPRLVVRVTDGRVYQRMDYNLFGVVTSDTNPGFQPFGFAGGVYDSDLQLIRFGARDYDPGTARWTSGDPILFEGGDTNLYGYTMNDPVNFIDPKGLWAITIGVNIGGYVGGGFGIGGGIYFGTNDHGGFSGGAYGSGETGFGGGGGASVCGGYYPGNTSSIAGPSINYNGGADLFSGSRITNPTNGNTTGYTGGIGPSTPVSGSITGGNTVTIGW